MTLTLHELRLRASYAAVLLFLGCFLALLGIRIGATQAADQTAPEKNFAPEMDISAGIYGQLTYTRRPTTTGTELDGTFTTDTTQGTFPSAGVSGTFHQSFKPWLGYNVDFGYTRFSENYSYGQMFVPKATSGVPGSSSFNQGSIDTSMYNLTISYVCAGPRNRKFSTFGEFGGGGLIFLPEQSAASPKDETRPAMVFGVGMNYKLGHHVDLQTEYRGIFYKSPDFGLPLSTTSGFPMTKLFTVTSAPKVSLVYRFGATRRVRSSSKTH